MELLFNRVDIFSVVEHQKQQLKATFPHVTNAELDADPIAVASRLIEQFSINVPVLEEEKKYALTKETQVDVSGDPRRFITDRSRPFYVGGTEVRIVVPFQGDAGVFGVQPTSFNLNPPRGEVNGQELHLAYRLTDANFDVESDANRTIGQVKWYLGNLQTSAEQLKRDLQQVVNSLIHKRTQERGTHSQIVAALKIPVRKAPPATASSPARRPKGEPTVNASAAEWDVFISHASEDKDLIARPLAEVLRERGLQVWYDEFSLKLGDDLRQSIDRGLGRSRFGVVILSGYFFEKHWPQQELNGLAMRETNSKNVILPVWHGVSFAEVCNYSPMLANRVAVETKNGLSRVVEKIMEVVVEISG